MPVSKKTVVKGTPKKPAKSFEETLWDTSIEVQGTPIKIQSVYGNDYICLTDIAKSKNADHPDDLIRNWLRNRNTLELLGIWEQLHNPTFNPVEFDGIRKQAGLNSFTLTPKQWIARAVAIGIQSKAGRYGGTFAHKDIAFEFASWVSVEFKLYLIKDFQRLKDDENRTDVDGRYYSSDFSTGDNALDQYGVKTSQGHIVVDLESGEEDIKQYTDIDDVLAEFS